MFVKLFLILTVSTSAFASTLQLHVPRIDQMADVPQPLNVIDFHKLAIDFDRKIYDFNQTGAHWPLIWWDTSGSNFNQPTIGIYTTIGDSRQGPVTNGGQYHEAVTAMGAVLGASLVGIDKSKGAHNYVGMLKNFFNRDTGWNIMQNNVNPKAGAVGGGYGRDWWYDVFPNVLFYAIYSQYPHEKDFDWMARSIADKFYAADQILKGDYGFSFFDYAKMRPVKSQICAQPDAAAGHAYVLYNAYKKFGDIRYLEGARRAMRSLEANTVNPSYEVLAPFGALMGARLNAEHGDSFDMDKLLAFSLDGTAVCREGWGALVGTWNGIDISGIVGSTVDKGGYGFLMNTYDMAWALLPIARYDQRYAAAVAKWTLNAANASRLFYPQYTDETHQTLKSESAITKGVIAYEGLAKISGYEDTLKTTQAPVAQGDGPHWLPSNEPVTQFSVYGSAHVGLFGSTIQTTEVPGILRLDLLATDFFHDKANPTYLYSNPFDHDVRVTLDLPTGSFDLYDTVSGTFIEKNVSNRTLLKLSARTAAVVVVVPHGGHLEKKDGKLRANGVVIDFRA